MTRPSPRQMKAKELADMAAWLDKKRGGLRPRRLVRRVASPSDPLVRVWRVTRFGVWVTLPDGRHVCWHPDDVEVVR